MLNSVLHLYQTLNYIHRLLPISFEEKFIRGPLSVPLQIQIHQWRPLGLSDVPDIKPAHPLWIERQPPLASQVLPVSFVSARKSLYPNRATRTVRS